MEKADCARLQAYLRKTFNNNVIRVVERPKKKDSAEVYIGDEYLAIIHEDKEDGDTSYSLTMAILDIDLE